MENDENRLDLIKFSADHILLNKDEAMMVIKAHLVAESLINELIDHMIPNSAALINARLSFRQLVALVESLRPYKNETWLWQALLKLNALRNEYAHNLSSDRIDKKREELIKATEPWIEPPRGSEDLLRFKFILHILCAQLANIRHGVGASGPLAQPLD